MNQTRPCVIPGPNNTTISAKFHKFYTQAYIVHPSPMVGGHNGGQVSNELALVELPDGSVESIPACNVRFINV